MHPLEIYDILTNVENIVSITWRDGVVSFTPNEDKFEIKNDILIITFSEKSKRLGRLKKIWIYTPLISSLEELI